MMPTLEAATPTPTMPNRAEVQRQLRLVKKAKRQHIRDRRALKSSQVVSILLLIAVAGIGGYQMGHDDGYRQAWDRSCNAVPVACTKVPYEASPSQP